MSYGLCGKIVAVQGQGDALAGHLLDAAAALSDVENCRLYLVNRDPSDADAVWVMEVWDSAAAHQASLQLEAVQQLIARARPIIATMGERFELDPIGGKGVAAPPAHGGPVRQMRLVVTAQDYDEALAFYRDTLGLPQEAAFSSEGGRVVILDAGRATLELADPIHAEYIDEVEVGRRVAGHIRVAFEVDSSVVTTQLLMAAGAQVLAPPTPTPWNSVNARLEGPAGLQLTLFSDPAAAE